MSQCCQISQPGPREARQRCPENGLSYPPVSRQTILQHLAHPWRESLPEQTYYFCEDPDCTVVYFGADGSTLTEKDLRTSVGIKSQSPDAPVCYCFGVSRADALDDPDARAFVIEQTRLGMCACETRNPAGRCCLKDFPRAHQVPPKAIPD